MTSKRRRPFPSSCATRTARCGRRAARSTALQVGYWEWFRKDGTKLRSGHFDNGQQTGEWTTYDKRGQVYKVTTMKPKSTRKA